MSRAGHQPPPAAAAPVIVPPLKLAFVASELTPLAKTGGLADVVAALPRQLRRLGHDVRVFLPHYRTMRLDGWQVHPVEFIQGVRLRMGWRDLGFSVVSARSPESGLEAYLIQCDDLYARSGVYAADGDEHVRFAFLARAAIECCQRMGFAPDVFHCHDWHAGLLPLYLRRSYGWDELFRRSRTLLTIHNIAYQGVFPAGVLSELELEGERSAFDREELAAGRIGFLGAGVRHADLISTVSPTYAREIQGDELGMGLQGLLRRRSSELVGILNGVDYEDWDPATDRWLEHHYSPDDLSGKELEKERLLGDLSLPRQTGAPLLGVVSRLTPQKGFELLYRPLPELLESRNVRFVALGTGDPDYEGFFADLERSFPGKVCFYRGFSEELAHRIEAAADIFLMPSRFEPCGLNQMYSLKYGTVPVVHRTGGLADSVEQWDWERQTGTGFLFEHFGPDGLRWALHSALETYRHPQAWTRLMLNGMSRDFSWQRQAEEYVKVYRRLTG